MVGYRAIRERSPASREYQLERSQLHRRWGRYAYPAVRKSLRLVAGIDLSVPQHQRVRAAADCEYGRRRDRFECNSQSEHAWNDRQKYLPWPRNKQLGHDAREDLSD